MIEDDLIEKKMLCIALEETRFRTITAANGADAIESAWLVPPGLIESDICMPTVDVPRSAAGDRIENWRCDPLEPVPTRE